MDVVGLNPIVPLLPDASRALLGPALVAAVAVLAALAAVLARVLAPGLRARRSGLVLDVVAPSVVEEHGSPELRTS